MRQRREGEGEGVKAHWKNHFIRPFRQACIDIGITDRIPTYTYSNKSIYIKKIIHISLYRTYLDHVSNKWLNIYIVL